MEKKIIITESQAYMPIDEAKASTHFKDRLKDRLNSIDLPSKDIIRIHKEIKKINRTKYDKDKGYAVRIIRFNPDPSSSAYVNIKGKEYYRVYDEKGKDSTGNELWVIVRNNEIKTFMIRKSVQTSNPEYMKRRLRVDEIIY